MVIRQEHVTGTCSAALEDTPYCCLNTSSWTTDIAHVEKSPSFIGERVKKGFTWPIE
jgi:hypothetical protein